MNQLSIFQDGTLATGETPHNGTPPEKWADDTTVTGETPHLRTSPPKIFSRDYGHDHEYICAGLRYGTDFRTILTKEDVKKFTGNIDGLLVSLRPGDVLLTEKSLALSDSDAEQILELKNRGIHVLTIENNMVGHYLRALKHPETGLDENGKPKKIPDWLSAGALQQIYVLRSDLFREARQRCSADERIIRNVAWRQSHLFSVNQQRIMGWPDKLEFYYEWLDWMSGFPEKYWPMFVKPTNSGDADRVYKDRSFDSIYYGFIDKTFDWKREEYLDLTLVLPIIAASIDAIQPNDTMLMLNWVKTQPPRGRFLTSLKTKHGWLRSEFFTSLKERAVRRFGFSKDEDWLEYSNGRWQTNWLHRALRSQLENGALWFFHRIYERIHSGWIPKDFRQQSQIRISVENL